MQITEPTKILIKKQKLDTTKTQWTNIRKFR